MATYEDILVEREGNTAVVTLNRPERRNPLSLHMIEELTAAFRAIGEDAEGRVAILRANGPAFSAGHDIAEMSGKDGAFYRELFGACTVLMETIQGIPQPVIAQVHATATAAGCQLVASCDLAVAATEARFATPGVRIGLFCSTPMVALSRAVGARRAMEMLLTGEPISAAEALEAGLVNRVVPAGELAAATRALAAKIASSSPYVVAIGKAAFYRQLQMPQPLAYDYAQDVMSMNARAADAQEGFQAFLQKRPPKWCGK
ncbi:MAG TPA: enoyl-CoA hydratase [Myxococcales bacterium]|nr:enoyl-CoA hydratase [Myxococcales bacterium]